MPQPEMEAMQAQDIIDFWFAADTRKLWFDSTPGFDAELRERFLSTWQRARDGELDDWMQSADGCVALAVVLDQFPLNMFRGSVESYSTEARAREVARTAIERGLDGGLQAERKAFLYLPFMHSEDLEDQRLALRLFDQPGLESNLRFARHHHDIVARFGRFPHRNAALGRDSSEEEIAYLNSDEAFTG